MSDLNKAVFLSYASQDAEAAKRICEALRAAGVEVWFDQNELVGGDAWDAKIRGQISSCALFVPIISGTTQARLEGYFRLEWKLAAQRTHTMADEKTFLLPVVIDDTRDADAKVPAEFKAVQWTRLPGGETPAKFSERVKKLLGGEVAQVSDLRSETGRAINAGHRPAPPPSPASRPWLIPALIGIVAVAILAIWQPWKNDQPVRAEAKPMGAPSVPVSEAQKLVQQARKVYENGDELDRETLVLADDLVKRALALDAAEPSAWLLGAQLSYTMVWQSFDMSETRKADLQRQAARARALAPDSVPAQLAVANARVAVAYSNFQSASNRQDLADVERDLLALAERAPRDYQVQRTLGQAYRFLKRPDEALRSLQRALELSGGDSGVSADLSNVLLRRKRYAEAETIMAAALARRPTGRLMVFDVFIKIRWPGDLAGAQAALANWPGWLMREDRGAFVAWQTWLWSRQPDRALDVAQRLPRDYLHDVWFTGPRAVLTARAHEMAGHREAAQADWRTAVRLADQELAGSPDDVPALFWKAWALSRLGDQTGAEATSTLLQQRMTSQTVFLNSTNLSLLWSTMGRTDLAAAHLKTGFGADEDTYGVTRAMLELDPAYEPLRAAPQFAELAAAALAPEAKKETAAASSLLATHSSLPATAADKSVAVLAFANLSDDKANEYFSDGISEELLNVLAKVPGLTVRGRSSGFYFKGKQIKSAEIGSQLKVAYLVQGSVRKAGDRVRISAQLIRAATDEVIWSSGSLDRDLKDIFAVQDEIAGLIAKNLSVTMGVAARAPHQVNPEALTALLEGRQYWVLRTMEGFARAGELFKRAVELDPEWAPAHAALANLMTIEASYRRGGGESVGARFTLAALEAKRAIELDPTLGEPHAALGKIAMENLRLAEAGEEFRRALALEPNNALVRDWYGDLLVTQGRLDLAIAEYQRAAEIEPLSPYILWDLAWELMHVRRYGDALVLVERAIALTPNGAPRLTIRRARLLLELGRKAEAEAVLRLYLDGPETDSDPQLANELVWCLQLLGLTPDRERWTADLLRQSPDSFSSGVILLMLGQHEKAFPLLERCPPIFWQQLYWDPVFDPERDTPRFQQMLEKLGCAAEYKVARETLARLLREPAVAEAMAGKQETKK